MQNDLATKRSASRAPITLYAESLAGGGSSGVALRLAKGFVEKGHDVDLLLNTFQGDYRDKLLFSRLSIYYLSSKIHSFGLLDYFRSHGLKARRIVVNPLREPLARRALKDRYPSSAHSRSRVRRALGVVRYIHLRKPKAMYTVSHRSSMIAIYARQLIDPPPPLIVSIHDNLEGSASHQQPEVREAFPGADAIVCVSQGLTESAIRICDLPQAKVSTIYNPIPHLEIATMSREEVSHPWFSNNEIPVIFTAARLSPLKDHRTLISAFALVCKEREARLVIMADGTADQAEPLLSQAAKLGLSEKFDLLEFDPNPFRYMQRSSCFVLSSITEGLSLVLIEAMACGTPVVSTDAPYGPREILEDGKWGALVAVGNPEQLAKAILETLDAVREKESARLMERARFFCAEKATNEYLSLMHKLSSEKASNA